MARPPIVAVALAIACGGGRPQGGGAGAPPAEPPATPAAPAPAPPPNPASVLPADLSPAVVEAMATFEGIPLRVRVDDDGTVRAAGWSSRDGTGAMSEAFAATAHPGMGVAVRTSVDIGYKHVVRDVGYDAVGSVIAACAYAYQNGEFALRLDSAQAWRSKVPGSEVRSVAVAGDASSDVLADVYPAGNQGTWSTLVTHVAADGTVAWTRELASAVARAGVAGAAIARRRDGDLLVVGRAEPFAMFLAHLSPSAEVRSFTVLDEGQLAVRYVDALDVAEGPEGRAFILVQRSFAGGEWYSSVLAVASDGSTWERVLGQGFWSASRLAVDAAGNVWVAIPGAIAAFRPDGTLVAAAALPLDWSATSLAVRGDVPYVAGFTASTGDSGPPGFVARLAPLAPR